jgi:hypothetical protein
VNALPVIVLLAVDIAVSRVAFRLAVQRLSTLATLQTGSVPPSVHRQEIEPVGDPVGTPCAHHNVIDRGRRCSGCPRVGVLLHFGVEQWWREGVAVAEGPTGPHAVLAGPIERGPAQTGLAVVVAWRQGSVEVCATAVGSATVTAVAGLHVPHGRVDRQVGRQVAGRVVSRSDVAVVLLLKQRRSVT